MRRIVSMLFLGLFILSCCAQDASKCGDHCKKNVKLIYCSCSDTHNGLPPGELQYTYYALVADEGAEPYVEYCEDRGTSKDKTKYPATAEDVAKLQKMLCDMNVKSLDGYEKDDAMCGGISHRIYMEFSNGKKVNARWYTHSPKQSAVKAYNAIHTILSEIVRRENGGKSVE